MFTVNAYNNGPPSPRGEIRLTICVKSEIPQAGIRRRIRQNPGERHQRHNASASVFELARSTVDSMDPVLEVAASLPVIATRGHNSKACRVYYDPEQTNRIDSLLVNPGII